MNIIQSFWTKPIRNIPEKISGGWPHKRYHFMSWAYSCLQLSKYYKNVNLCTDDLGKKILIDKIGLPYNKVTTDLNNLDSYDPKFWVLGKIYTYKLQTEAFIHVDSDVFIFERFKEDFESAQLLAQSIERTGTEYFNDLKKVISLFDYQSESLNCYRNSNSTSCYNAGLLGGSNIKFLQQYATEALEVIDANMHKISNASIMHVFNCLAEQYVFYGMIREFGENIQLLIDDDYIDKFMSASVRESVRNFKYSHFMGGGESGYKKNIHNCSILENWLKAYYPQYFYRIDQLIVDKEI